MGVAGLSMDFSDADLILRINTATGEVMLGDQVVTDDNPWDYKPVNPHGIAVNEGFSIG